MVKQINKNFIIHTLQKICWPKRSFGFFHKRNPNKLFGQPYIYLEKAMAPHSSTLAWKIPWTGEPLGLPSMGSHRVGHDWRDLAAAAADFHFIPKGNEMLREVGHTANKWEIHSLNWLPPDFKIPVFCIMVGCSNHKKVSTPCLAKYLYVTLTVIS